MGRFAVKGDAIVVGAIGMTDRRVQRCCLGLLFAGLLGASVSASAGKLGCTAAPSEVDRWLEEAQTATLPPWQRFVPTPAAEGDCSFYKLGWQSFLYLMQEVKAGDVTAPRFLTWKRAADTFPAVINLGKTGYGLAFRPTAWDDTVKPPRSGPINKTGVLIAQAKPAFPLYTPNGALTEFGVRANKAEYNYTVCQNLYTQGCFDQRIRELDTRPIELPLSSRSSQGSVELKLAWVSLGPAEKKRCRDRLLYCTDGFDRFNRPATLGLVGMHIVVFHETVPSGIWMTFEHRANAPDCGGGSKLTDLEHWTFSDAPADAAGWSCTSASFEATTGTDSAKACRLDARGVTVGVDGTPVCNCRGTVEAGAANPPESDPSPTFVCRTTPLVPQAASLNASVIRALDEPSSGPTIVAGYRLVGSLWLDPSNSDTSAALGSPGLSNTTMETYVQTVNFEPLSCLGCHNTASATTKNPNPDLNRFHGQNLTNAVGRSFFFNGIDISTTGYCPNVEDLPAWCGQQ